MIGRTLSHYQIQEELSRGGMGVVYRAVDTKLDREVAVKILPPELTADETRRRRFVQEAKAAAAIHHSNIATIHEIDEAGGVHFIVMELIEGEKLSGVLPRERLSVSRTLELATELAEGLSKAHEKGVVHRDLKPANIVSMCARSQRTAASTERKMLSQLMRLEVIDGDRVISVTMGRVRIVEAVPNISEGRRKETVSEIAKAFGSAPGVVLLDVSSDASHNRTVLTAVGAPEALEKAALALYAAAIERIDLRQHQGEHPRVGAVDVVPFVPIEGVTMEDCVALARRVGAEVASRFELPVFLYEEAALNPSRTDLAAIRKGEFEGLAEKLRDPAWKPDYGPGRPHPSAGATVVGARVPLIAFNVNLGTDRLDVAKTIAKAVRHSSGGLRFVKALGIDLAEKKQVQVSMNLTDYRKTPIFRAFEIVRLEAERHGVPVVGSEIVGMVPADALFDSAEHFLRLIDFRRDQVLEDKIRKAIAEDPGARSHSDS